MSSAEYHHLSAQELSEVILAQRQNLGALEKPAPSRGTNPLTQKGHLPTSVFDVRERKYKAVETWQDELLYQAATLTDFTYFLCQRAFMVIDNQNLPEKIRLKKIQWWEFISEVQREYIDGLFQVLMQGQYLFSQYQEVLRPENHSYFSLYLDKVVKNQCDIALAFKEYVEAFFAEYQSILDDEARGFKNDEESEVREDAPPLTTLLGRQVTAEGDIFVGLSPEDFAKFYSNLPGPNHKFRLDGFDWEL